MAHPGNLWRYIGIALYDEGVYRKNERNIKQSSNACHQNNVMVRSLKITWNAKG